MAEMIAEMMAEMVMTEMTEMAEMVMAEIMVNGEWHTKKMPRRLC
jgi:hypothetical protein